MKKKLTLGFGVAIAALTLSSNSAQARLCVGLTYCTTTGDYCLSTLPYDCFYVCITGG